MSSARKQRWPTLPKFRLRARARSTAAPPRRPHSGGRRAAHAPAPTSCELTQSSPQPHSSVTASGLSCHGSGSVKGRPSAEVGGLLGLFGLPGLFGLLGEVCPIDGAAGLFETFLWTSFLPLLGGRLSSSPASRAVARRANSGVRPCPRMPPGRKERRQPLKHVHQVVHRNIIVCDSRCRILFL